MPACFQPSRSLATRIVSKKEVNTYKGIWRHPAKGTGEICDKLAEEILKAGALIHYKAQVTRDELRFGWRRSRDGRQKSVSQAASDHCHRARSVLRRSALSHHTSISSIPPGLLKRFLANSATSRPVHVLSPQNLKPQHIAKRTVILIYLFLNEEPRFPHAWLQVTCPSTRIGRITNYAAFSPDMVPKERPAYAARCIASGRTSCSRWTTNPSRN